MKVDDIQKVAVIGSGTMGNGIAQVFASNGFAVTVIDVDREVLERALSSISKSLDRIVKKGAISEQDKAAALGKIRPSTDLGDARDAQLVIEAVTENLKVKLDIFCRLASICPPDTIFASNTSSLPITQLATSTKRADKF